MSLKPFLKSKDRRDIRKTISFFFVPAPDTPINHCCVAIHSSVNPLPAYIASAVNVEIANIVSQKKQSKIQLPLKTSLLQC